MVKVAALGLSEKQLGLSLKQVHPKLVDLNNKYGLHLCGEGGEYETIVLDCPLYKKRIEIVESRVVKHGEDVWYLEILQVNLVDKESNPESRDFSQIVKTPRFEDHDLGLSLDAMAINLEKLSIVEPSPPVQSHSPTFTMINNFFAISGITSSAPSLSAQTTEIFSALLSILEFHKLGLTDLILITVHLPSMTSFTTFNAIYSSFFNLNPPARVTLSTSSTLQIDVLGSTSTLDHLHVKSISYWAPSNIGPYSQLVTCGNLGFMAGMIGLVPAQMELSNNEFCQAHASLCRVVEGFEENFLYKMVFVVEGVDVGVVKKLGKRMGVVRLKGLPKDARVEIQSVVGSGVDFKSEKWDGGFVDLARGEEMTIWNAGFRTVEDLSRLKVDWESVLSVRVFYTEDVRDSVKLAVESWAERNVSVTYVPVLEVDIGLKIGLNIYCFKT